MPKLTFLYLDSNKLRELIFEAEMSALKVLSVVDNKLAGISGTEFLSGLAELYLDSNVFMSLP